MPFLGNRKTARKAGITAALSLGVGTMLVLTAVPGSASDDSDVAPGGTAYADAMTANVGGQTIDDKLSAVYDGANQVLNGPQNPVAPKLANQSIVSGGALSQDAGAGPNWSAACAGLVGNGGKVRVGPEKSCLVDSDGTVSLSLGTLPQLGLEDVLSKLPKLPDVPELPIGDLTDLTGLLGQAGGSLPNAELRLVGNGLSSWCSVGPEGNSGQVKAAKARIVAVVDDQEITISEVQSNGTVVKLDSVIDKVRTHLDADSTAVLDKLAPLLAKLPSQDFLNVKLGEKREAPGFVEVTALHASLKAPELPIDPTTKLPLPTPELAKSGELTVGRSICSAPATSAPLIAEDNKGDKSALKGQVEAGAPDAAGKAQPKAKAEAKADKDGNAELNADVENTSNQMPIGIGAAALIVLAALALGGGHLYRLRKR